MKAVALVATCCLMAGGALAGERGGGVAAGPGGHPVSGNHGPTGTAGHRPYGPYGAYGRRGLGYGYGPGYGYDYGLGYGGLYPDEPFYEPYNSGEYPPPGAAGPNVLMISPPAPAVQEMAVHPVIHEYGDVKECTNPPNAGPPAEGGETSPIVYLLALRDKNIHAATTYWIAGGTLHYLDTDHKERQVPLSAVDRDLSAKLNRERNVPFNLP